MTALSALNIYAAYVALKIKERSVNCQLSIVTPQSKVSRCEKMKREGVGLFLYREYDLVLGPGSFVEGGHAIFSPEVQMGSSVLQDLDHLHHVVQVSCKRQRALWKKQNILMKLFIRNTEMTETKVE